MSKQIEETQQTIPHLEPINDAFVLGGIDLDPAFDEIERDDGRVRDAAWQEATDAAQNVVFGGSDLAWGRVVSGWKKEWFNERLTEWLKRM